jgi:hypothetical protein
MGAFSESMFICFGENWTTYPNRQRLARSARVHKTSLPYSDSDTDPFPYLWDGHIGKKNIPFRSFRQMSAGRAPLHQLI